MRDEPGLRTAGAGARQPRAGGSSRTTRLAMKGRYAGFLMRRSRLEVQGLTFLWNPCVSEAETSMAGISASSPNKRTPCHLSVKASASADEQKFTKAKPQL